MYLRMTPPPPPTTPAPPCPTEVVEAREGSLQGMFEWPETGVGSVSRLQCPCPTNSELTKGVFAIRKCRASGVWSQPDWSACRLSAQSQRLCMVVSGCIHKGHSWYKQYIIYFKASTFVLSVHPPLLCRARGSFCLQ